VPKDAPMSSGLRPASPCYLHRVDEKPAKHLIREPATEQTERLPPVVTRCHPDPEVGLSTPAAPALCDRDSVKSGVDLKVAGPPGGQPQLQCACDGRYKPRSPWR
jgi:hypothetical protein